MRVRDILEIMDEGALLYVKNINQKHECILLPKNIVPFCSDLLLDLHVKKLNAGDYELKGDTIDWRNNWYRGKVIVCEVDEE
jgi:hypothetical protein